MPKIIKATAEQKAEYLEQRKDIKGQPPLYGYVEISEQECAIEFVGEGQGEPNYELIAPSGYCFGPDLHGYVASTLKELQADIDVATLEQCDHDCGCGEGI